MPDELRFRAVYHTTSQDWVNINVKHTRVLADHIGPADKVLEVGCGWGRLLSLMPGDWKGVYFGIDLSPEFIALARTEVKRPNTTFVCAHAENVLGTLPDKSYDWAVFVSIRQMLKSNGQSRLWDDIERECRRVAKRLLVLEYTPDEDGEVLS